MKKIPLFLSAFTMASIGFAQEAPAQVAGFKVSGFLQYRTEYTTNPRVSASQAGDALNADLGPTNPDGKNESLTMLWVNIDKQLDEYTRFHAIVNAEALAGRTTSDYLKLWAAFMEAKVGPATFSLGRFLMDLGEGTLGSAPYMDGVRATVGNEYVEAQVYVTKFGNPGQAPDYNTADKSTFTFLTGDLKVHPVKGLTLSASYFGDRTTQDPVANMIGGTLYKSWAAGAEYKYVADAVDCFTLSGEYADNSGAMAKKINGTTAPYAVMKCVEGPDPKAYYVKAKLMGAKPNKP